MHKVVVVRTAEKETNKTKQKKTTTKPIVRSWTAETFQRPMRNRSHRQLKEMLHQKRAPFAQLGHGWV
jgi:hypothetical protein